MAKLPRARQVNSPSQAAALVSGLAAARA
jgi:hypothetical protein